MKYSVFLGNLKKSVFAIVMILLSVVFLSGSLNAHAQAVNGSPTLSAVQNTLSQATTNPNKAVPNDPSLDSASSTKESGVILKNSTVQLDPAIFKDPKTENNFYPGDTINMLALIESVRNRAGLCRWTMSKLYLSKDIFNEVSDNEHFIQ